MQPQHFLFFAYDEEAYLSFPNEIGIHGARREPQNFFTLTRLSLNNAWLNLVPYQAWRTIGRKAELEGFPAWRIITCTVGVEGFPDGGLMRLQWSSDVTPLRGYISPVQNVYL